MVEFAGWEMPVQYSGVIEEHLAVRTAAGLFDVSHMGELRVAGRRAEEALQLLTPNDVSRLQPGRAHYSALLSERGTYLDDLLVYRLQPDEFLLVVNAVNAQRDLEWIASRDGDGVAVDDVSERHALLALQGPASEAILQQIAACELSDLKYYRFRWVELDGRRALVSRTGYTGEDGFEIFTPPEDAAALWQALSEIGAARGLLPAGLGARDTLRLEAAMALYGHELDESTTPLEAGLEWTVKWQKGEFVGRQALLAQQREGVGRRLVGFEIVGRGIARQGAAVVAGGRRIGTVTSGTWSPTFEKAIGMAYVEADQAAPARRLSFDVRGRSLDGEIVELPFYRRR